MRRAKSILRYCGYGIRWLKTVLRTRFRSPVNMPFLVNTTSQSPIAPMRFPTYDEQAGSTLVEHSDYVRYATIGLALQRIEEEHIPGHVAELGVYQGPMSRFIHQLVPERMFYLFDIFTGLPNQNLEASSDNDKDFRNTSIAIVLHTIGDRRNIVVKQCYIPTCYEGLEQEQFAFVLLDVELYTPTLISLEFFYPRLASGGYLMVHDYNNPVSQSACKKAITEFMLDKPEKIIELADEWGSVIFRKI